MERHARDHLATWYDVQRRVRKDVIPVIGQMPAGEVRKRHLHLVIDRLVTGGHAVSARGLLFVISAIFTWAEGREPSSTTRSGASPTPSRPRLRNAGPLR